LGPAPADAFCLQCERSDGQLMRISAGLEDTYHLHQHCAKAWFAGLSVRGPCDPNYERKRERLVICEQTVNKLADAPPSDPNACAAWVLGKLKGLPDECAGYQNARQWRLARASMVQFATTEHAFGNRLAQALQLGWTLAELFAISADPAVGAKALDQCGALLPNVHGATVTRVDKQALHFSDGLVTRKRLVAPKTCLVWSVRNNNSK
jgi:hypothetical protein